MTKSLRERLQSANQKLNEVRATIDTHGTILHADAFTSINGMLDGRHEIAGWLDILDSREAAKQALNNLHQSITSDGMVQYGDRRVAFHIGRFLTTQSYVATSWALADSMSAMIGRILCIAEASKNENSPPQLVNSFVNKGKSKGTTAVVVFETIRSSYGWPIAIAYGIRNHFLHDGAHSLGISFFDGRTSSDEFKISDKGWSEIELRASNYGVSPANIRSATAWPAIPKEDLRELLVICENEMDEALGILLGSSCASIAAHVGFLLGQD